MLKVLIGSHPCTYISLNVRHSGVCCTIRGVKWIKEPSPQLASIFQKHHGAALFESGNAGKRSSLRVARRQLVFFSEMILATAVIQDLSERF
jgi:hypothetical protein